MGNTIMSFQVIPTVPAGEHPYDYVDQALEIVEASGVKYEVNALDTTLEGDFTELIALVSKVNEALITSGAKSVMMQMKTTYHPAGITVDKLLHKYR